MRGERVDSQENLNNRNPTVTRFNSNVGRMNTIANPSNAGSDVSVRESLETMKGEATQGDSPGLKKN